MCPMCAIAPLHIVYIGHRITLKPVLGVVDGGNCDTVYNDLCCLCNPRATLLYFNLSFINDSFDNFSYTNLTIIHKNDNTDSHLHTTTLAVGRPLKRIQNESKSNLRTNSTENNGIVFSTVRTMF